MEMSFAELSFARRQYLRFWLSNAVRLVSFFKVTKETFVVWLLVHVPCQQHTLLKERHFCPLTIMFHSNSLLISWIKIDQLDVTCFIISLFTAQRVSNVSTSIFRSLPLIVDLFHVLYCSGSMCVGVTHIEPEQYNPWNKSTISRKLLKMDVLTFGTCWAVNSEIMKEVTSSWSIFIQLSSWCTVQ